MPTTLNQQRQQRQQNINDLAPTNLLALQQQLSEEEMITIPLQWIPSLNAYVLYFALFDKTPETFGAILDTGSPFLTVPSYCDRSKWGCYRPELTSDSGYPNTIERFDNNEGTVVWRQAPFSFVRAQGTMMGPEQIIFGVLDERLMEGSGGVFFGLIKQTDSWIRPSFLGQLSVRSFQIDLQSPQQKSLSLSTRPLLSPSDPRIIPLVRDLNRRYRDPVVHYTAIAESVSVNGVPLELPGSKKRPTYVIFDTGVTGMVVSRELFDQRYQTARQNREKQLWGTVEIGFRYSTSTSSKQQQQQDSIVLSAVKPVTTPLGEVPWPGFRGNLIVMGLAFLDGHVMTVDIEEGRLRID